MADKEQEQISALKFVYSTTLVLTMSLSTFTKVGDLALLPFMSGFITFAFAAGLTFFTYTHKNSKMPSLVRVICTGCFGCTTFVCFLCACMFWISDAYNVSRYLGFFLCFVPMIVGGILLHDVLGAFFGVKLGEGKSTGGSGSGDANAAATSASNDINDGLNKFNNDVNNAFSASGSNNNGSVEVKVDVNTTDSGLTEPLNQ